MGGADKVPRFGAFPSSEGVLFSVWAPQSSTVDVVLFEEYNCDSPEKSITRVFPLEKKDCLGTFQALIKNVHSETLYKYLLDGNKGPFPDPVSRFQPFGVHGPSQIVDSNEFTWSDASWKGFRSMEELIIYELHVGTFTEEGTFLGLIDRLSYLKELGITAIELMPLGDFPGSRNWGYDGVCLYAPARCYGKPNDLRLLVDRAHGLGLAVLLDVVYNHLGPDGNYLSAYSPFYFTSRHSTPWGPALNIDKKRFF